MSDDKKGYEYPFEMAPEDEIRFRDAGAIEGRIVRYQPGMFREPARV